MDAITVQCDTVSETIVILAYILNIGAIIYSLDMLHKSHRRIELLTAALCFLYLVLLTMLTATCVLSSLPMFNITNLMILPLIACFESIVLLRCQIFNSIQRVRPSVLVVIGVVYWLVCLMTLIAGMAQQLDLMINISYTIAPLTLLIEIPTAYFSLAVVRTAQRTKYDSPTQTAITKHTRRVMIALNALALLVILTILNTVVFYSVMKPLVDGTVSMLPFSLFCLLALLIGFASTVSYNSLVEIVHIQVSGSYVAQIQQLTQTTTTATLPNTSI